MKEIHQIYDKAFKRILTLSEKTVINLINGLFGTDYPTNSKITYNWTEHENKDLKKTLADSILTINGKDSYHIEAQMTEDEEIVFRFIEYGFGHAYKNRTFVKGGERMVFPRPCILYLDEGKKDKVPDEYTLIMQFENQGEFEYKVPLVKLQNISSEELTEKKLIALLPFQLLKLRKKLKETRTKENFEELQRIVEYDILRVIYKNAEVGNISHTDALDLVELTTKLYMKIYSKYKELEEFTMRMCDQSLELISDKYEKTVEELQDEIEQISDKYEKKVEELQAQKVQISDKYEKKVEELQAQKVQISDKYEKKVEELQAQKAQISDKYERKLEELQDEVTEIKDALATKDQIIEKLQRQLAEKQNMA